MSAELYKLIRVAGRDAGEFLQGQLTQDMERLAQAGSLPAAMCNPKGRVITLLRIVMIADGFGLVAPATVAASVCDRLKVYRLRADVSLELVDSGWACLACRTDADLRALDRLDLRPNQEINACRIGHGLIAVNVGIEEQCVELMGFTADLQTTGIEANGAADILRGAKIRAGIPEILPPQAERYTPHMLNLDLLGAVSFDKGCYTGQEIIARTQFLGSSKRRLVRYRATGGIRDGDKLSDGENEVGEVLNVFGKDLLAVVPLNLHNTRLFVDGQEIAPAPMPYSVTGS